MARRKKNEDLASILATSPWWLSVAAGCVVYAAMRWIIPAVLGPAPMLAPLASMIRTLAWVPLVVFGFIAVIAFLGSPPTQRRSSMEAAVPASVHERPTALTRRRIGTEWGRSVAGVSAEPAEPGFSRWTIEALRVLEWKRFELLCAKYYETIGFVCQTQQSGADGGIDVRLFKSDLPKPLAIVQCKAWTAAVGVKEVRELLGIMAHEKVARGIFITTGSYTRDALEFGRANPIQLLDGPAFLDKIIGLPLEQRNELSQFAFNGDYRTPTCASCGIKLVRRDGKRGPFWGCVNYPRCKTTLPYSA